MERKIVSGIMLTLLLIGMLTLAFNIQPVRASGTIYIRADGSVEPEGTPISSIDNVTYTFTDNIYDEIVVERDNIVVDGAGYILQGTGSGTGIDLTERSNVTIKNMEIKSFYYCIWLQSSSYNSISGNNITNNEYGINLYYSGNIIYHNNFVDNTEQVDGTYRSSCVWDDGYPSGGNYWSDYTGVDVKSGPNQDQPSSDGIGDTAYVIDANNRDNYPLMYPWGSPPPPAYTLTIYSSPTGVTFTVDGVSRTTPWSGTYTEGTSVSLVMPEIHTVGDTRYYWNQWSDGNTSRTRTVTMTTNITLTAYYTGPYYGYELTVTSSPVTGITFTINGTPQTTPYTEWLLEGSYTLEMPQTHDGYVWSHWLEDGDTNRTKTVTMDTKITLTAVFACTFDVVLDDIHYQVSILSNSTVSNFNFNETEMRISFDVTGDSGTTGYCNVTIPKSLLKGDPWIIQIDSTPVTDFNEKTNDTHTFLYFTYAHESPLQVTIEGTWVVPEFPPLLILPLFIALSMLAIVFTKRRFQRKPKT